MQHYSSTSPASLSKSATLQRPTTEQLARDLSIGSIAFKVFQAACHYSLPELRAMLRDAEAELYGIRQDPEADSLEVEWWQEWTGILKTASDQRTRTLPQIQSTKASNGVRYPDISYVKERSDIVTIVERHTDLKKMGRVFKGLCPFHNEKTPSFHVWPEENKYHCFGCNEHGSVLDFVMKAHNLNLTDGLHYLCDQAGIKWPEPRPSKPRWAVDL